MSVLPRLERIVIARRPELSLSDDKVLQRVSKTPQTLYNYELNPHQFCPMTKCSKSAEEHRAFYLGPTLVWGYGKDSDLFNTIFRAIATTRNSVKGLSIMPVADDVSLRTRVFNVKERPLKHIHNAISRLT